MKNRHLICFTFPYIHFPILPVMLFLWIFLLSYSIFPALSHAKIATYTLVEKTASAHLIVLARTKDIGDETYELSTLDGLDNNVEAPRFARYEIIETWKGRHAEDTLLLDFKLTNEKYVPFICRPPAAPAKDELAVLFLEKDYSLFQGFQGKINVTEHEAGLYRQAVLKFLELEALEGTDKISAIIRLVDEDMPFTKESLLWAIRNSDGRKYALEFAALLTHNDVMVRRSAVAAIIGTEDERALPYILSALKDNVAEVRGGAVDALTRYEGNEVTQALIEAYSDKSDIVRSRIIFALSNRHSQEAVPLFFQALKDPSPLVRNYGANALAEVGTKESVSSLLGALKDSDAMVRRSSLQALTVSLRMNESVPKEDVVGSAAKMLDDEDVLVRDAAAYLIAQAGWLGYREIINNKVIIDKLVRLLNLDDDKNVRISSCNALGTIASPEAVSALERALSDDESVVRYAAAEALFHAGNESSLPYLKEALEKEENENVRTQLEKAINMHMK